MARLKRLAGDALNDVLQYLTEEDAAAVVAGELTAWPGKDPKHPVLRYAAGNKAGGHPGALAPHSGHNPEGRHGDGAYAGKSSAWKRTNAYRQVLEDAIKAEGSAEEWGSWAWVIKKGLEAIDGGPVMKMAHCTCGNVFPVEMYRKPDPTIYFKTVEHILGRATETKDINVNADIYAVLDKREDPRLLRVFDVDEEESKRLREAIEGEYKELESGRRTD